MTYIYNKAERFVKWSLWLCLMALLPVQAYGVDKYGVLWEDNDAANTWRYQYQTKIQNGELPSTYESFAKGDGTISSPYLIESVWDLCRLEYHVNDRRIDFKGKYFKLVNDIDLDGYMWYPIGVAENPYESTSFSGYFDGNGKTVTVSVPMFEVFNGTIKNLTINGNITATQSAGSVAALSTDGMVAENITV